ncbi:hypothetical protein QA645_31955 [Bradyrhizobium sp. CIAT3101]|uniref:hypothetical protein n=1 Tax=Bradyrhizobium sp. CIAT3101 TaxID=439387 RepID=UPI0024B122B0|nr:hypothetical protein [Bradyrhizobium sp. CIAT3101]WFU79111.1 hypothetical protein QA645_31955 [Bradyrhizobium sp. CIAT3101]
MKRTVESRKNNCRLTSIEAIEERIAIIENMQRRLEQAFGRRIPADTQYWIN